MSGLIIIITTNLISKSTVSLQEFLTDLGISGHVAMEIEAVVATTDTTQEVPTNRHLLLRDFM